MRLLKGRRAAVNMRFTIAERYRPFSHQPGTSCVLPRTDLRFQIFPALIRVFEEEALVSEIQLAVLGPVKDFTVQLDLEKGRIRVWGTAASGYMRYSIYPAANQEKFVLVQETGTKDHAPECEKVVYERLSLGSSKAQDWDMVKRRMDMADILPVWFALGQQMAKSERAPAEGTAAVLHECRRAIIADDSRRFLEPFKVLFQTGFDGILAPRKTDVDYQGFQLPPVSSEFSSIALLSEGAELIRSLFFSYNDRVADILPALPVEFHCGRFIDVKCGSQGTVDMEWTKKAIRRVIFRASENGAIRFAFPRDIKRFRLRLSETDRGQKLEPHTPIEIVAGNVYYLDRFEK